MITVRVSEAQEQRLIRELAHIRDGAPRAMSAALNKTIVGVKTDTVRTLAKVYTIGQKKLRESVKVGRKATPAHLEASVIGETKKMPSLMDFKVSPKSVTKRRPAGGLRVQVKRGSSGRIPHGFIVRTGGGVIAAGRKGHSRLPIEKMFGPGVASMMDQEPIAAEVLGLAQARLDKNLEMALDAVEKGHV